MKKILVVLAFVLVATVLISCLPEKPQDVLPYCKDSYNALLVDYPDYPSSFIGACVSYFQTGKTDAFVSLCGYEPFRESLEMPEIDTKHECIEYIKDFTPPE